MLLRRLRSFLRPRSGRLRVALFSPSWPPERAHNGVVTYVSELAPELRRCGADVVVLAGHVDEGDRASVARDRVIDVGATRDTAVEFVRARVVQRTHGADHAASRHRAWMVKQSLRLADRSAPLDSYEIEEAFGTGRFLRRAPGRQVVRLHGPWQLCAPALGFDPSAPEHSSRIVDEGRAIAAADAVTSPSQHALDSVRRYYDLPLREAAVIPNAVALAPASARWSLERATPFSVLFVGRFDRLKGADTVLEAFGRLHAKIPEATLTFVGPDRGMPDGAGGTIHFEDFAARVLEPAARARVTYLGPRTRSEIADLRTRAAITVVASRFETFGMTVVEAMAAASPVIAARAGALPEVLRWADADALFEAGSAPALADALHRWLTDRERLASHADRGRAACAADYSPRTVAQRTLELHRRVTGRRAT